MLVVYECGDRSGNQLVAAAMLIASAEEHKVPYYYVGFQMADKIKNVNGGLHHLMSLGRSNWGRRIGRRLARLSPLLLKALRIKLPDKVLGMAEQDIDDFIHAAEDSRIHLWNCWLYTDFKALEKHKDEVRRRLSLRDIYTDAAHAVLAKARADEAVLIGVHVRRTDYKEWQNGRLYFSTEQYREWMRQCVSVSSKPVHFVICSDERLDEEAFRSGFEHVTFSHESLMTDMAVLSGCDYILGPPSTFSGFASFLGNVPKFSLNGAASFISSLEQFRVYLLEYTDVFCARNAEGLIGFNGPNCCLRIQDGIVGESVELMQDI